MCQASSADQGLNTNTWAFCRHSQALSNEVKRSACVCAQDSLPQDDSQALERSNFSRKLAAERAAQRAQAHTGLGRAANGRRSMDCSLLQVRPRQAFPNQGTTSSTTWATDLARLA